MVNNIMKQGYIPQDQRKKILLLADDIRMHSGIATMAREFVTGTAHIFNWAQIAGSVKHPDKGKIMNLDGATNTEQGITDSYVRLYPVDGYGDAAVLKQVMGLEKPDVILHFTDPRFWVWLYQIEREIRQQCPIAYLNIWDDLPYPMYNRAYYESCDLLLAISRQTLNINKWVLGPKNCQTVDGKSFDDNGEPTNDAPSSGNKPIVHYCPHGINTKTFYPVRDIELSQLETVKKEIFKKNYKYVIFYNSRNIRRKQTSTIMLAYRAFCDNLTPHEASECVLLMHTAPTDDAGTDLIACKEAFCPNYDVVISSDKLLPARMNQLYNIADVTIHLSDNEGFGIATAESLACGTPIIVTATGGLQDQCGFVGEDGKPVKFTREWSTNSDGRIKKHGSWVVPIYPGARMVQGSIPTPYILGDYGRWEDAAEAMMYWYVLGRDTRKARGEEGRVWLSNEGGLNSGNMCSTMVEGINALLKIWKGREAFNVFRHDEYIGHNMPSRDLGVVIPKINRDTIVEKLGNV